MIDPDKIGKLIVKGWSSREGKDVSERTILEGELEENQRSNSERYSLERGKVSNRRTFFRELL